jgi:uncharacterized protein (TIGR00369 family)
MPDSLDTLLQGLNSTPMPVCAQLTPFQVTGYDANTCTVRFLFSEQPLFSNHFGNVQGGFAVAMIDVVLSVAGFAVTGEWLPTVELNASFFEPLPIGVTLGEGRVLRAGKTVVFAEGRLSKSEGATCVSSTATLIRPSPERR